LQDNLKRQLIFSIDRPPTSSGGNFKSRNFWQKKRLLAVK